MGAKQTKTHTHTINIHTHTHTHTRTRTHHMSTDTHKRGIPTPHMRTQGVLSDELESDVLRRCTRRAAGRGAVLPLNPPSFYPTPLPPAPPPLLLFFSPLPPILAFLFIFSLQLCLRLVPLSLFRKIAESCSTHFFVIIDYDGESS